VYGCGLPVMRGGFARIATVACETQRLRIRESQERPKLLGMRFMAGHALDLAVVQNTSPAASISAVERKSGSRDGS